MAWVAQISVFIYFRSPDSPNQDPNTLYIVSCSAQRHLLRAYILSLLCLSIPLSSNCCIARSNMQMHFMDTHNNIMQAELFFCHFDFLFSMERFFFFARIIPLNVVIFFAMHSVIRFFFGRHCSKRIMFIIIKIWACYKLIFCFVPREGRSEPVGLIRFEC